MKKLDRELGLFSVFALSTGAMLGPGLFVLPGLAFKLGGASIILAYPVAGLLVIATALSKSEMATALPKSGGTYLFLDRSLGPLAGTLSGLGTWISLILKTAFSLIGLGAYLMYFTGLSPGYSRIAALLIGLGLIIVNALGGKKAGQVQTLLVLVTVFVLIDFVGWGSLEVDSGHYHPFFSRGTLGFFGATAFVFVSYAGITKVVSVAEEIKEPARNIPWGIILSLVTTLLTYTLVVYVIVGVVPPGDLGQGVEKLMPLVQAGSELGGYWGTEIMAGVAVLALASMGNAGLMAASRFPLPMARDRILPSGLARINRKVSTPLRSILLTGTILLAIVYFLPVKQLAKLASSFLLVVFGLVNVALVIFRESEIEWYKPSFRAPGYPYLQLFGALSCFSLIVFMGWFSIFGALSLVGVGLIWYIAYARRRTDRTGAFFRKPAVDEEEIELFRKARSNSENSKESVIVPFFGLEDVDMLKVERRIRLAAGLCDTCERLDVVDFIEVPEQAFLSGFEADQEALKALRQRVKLLRGEIDNEIHVDQVITHHSRGALRNYAEEEKPHWVVFDWQEPSPWQILIGGQKWWLEDFPCDILLFKDRNKVSLEQVIVLTEPGPYDGEVVSAADSIASYKQGSITFLNPLAPNSKKAYEFVNSYQEELKHMCKAPATAEMISSENWVEGVLEHTEEADLLVLGGLSPETFKGFSGENLAAEIVGETTCSVARVHSNLRSPQSVLGETEEQAPDLPGHLDENSIVTVTDATDKEVLFDVISKELAKTSQVKSTTISEALWRRERVQDTYIEKGLAFPHGILSDLEQTWVKIVTVDPPIEYNENGDKVRICVVTVGPPDDRQTHLQIIGKFSEYLVEEKLQEKLLAETDPKKIVAEIMERFNQNHTRQDVQPD